MGASISASDDFIAVGAPFAAGVPGTERGAVYLFRKER
jgi:hypothetical protein